MSPRLSTLPTVSDADKYRAEIRPAGAVDRRRHGHDVKIGFRKTAGLVFVTQARLRKIGRLNLARAVVSRAQFVDALAIDVKADHRRAGARKRDGDGKPYVAKTNDRDFPTTRHKKSSRRCARCLARLHQPRQ